MNRDDRNQEPHRKPLPDPSPRRRHPQPVAPPPGERDAAEPFARASLPFDLFQRHKLIQDAVGRIREGRRRLEILEVGGAPGHLRDFLPRDHVVVLDSGGQADLHGDAFRLPFRDGAFDIVVSLGALELLSARRRPAFLRELGRVTADAMMITAPFAAPRVGEAESILSTFLKKRLGMEHPPLDVPREFVSSSSRL